MQEKQEVIDDNEKLKSSRGDEHNDEDEYAIITFFNLGCYHQDLWVN